MKLAKKQTYGKITLIETMRICLMIVIFGKFQQGKG